MIRKIINKLLSDEPPENPGSHREDTIENVQNLLKTARYVSWNVLGREPSDELLVELMRYTLSTEKINEKLEQSSKVEDTFFDNPN